jgi:hypothetical protein
MSLLGPYKADHTAGGVAGLQRLTSARRLMTRGDGSAKPLIAFQVSNLKRNAAGRVRQPCNVAEGGYKNRKKPGHYFFTADYRICQAGKLVCVSWLPSNQAQRRI